MSQVGPLPILMLCLPKTNVMAPRTSFIAPGDQRPSKCRQRASASSEADEILAPIPKYDQRQVVPAPARPGVDAPEDALQDVLHRQLRDLQQAAAHALDSERARIPVACLGDAIRVEQ